MTYELMKHDKNSARVRTYAARAAIAAGLALILAGFSFAAQSGIGLASRLADHQHTGAGDGAVLQGLAPVGNFVISGNNAGNIGISSSITGTNFIWKPASTTFLAGQATDDSFYVNNIGGYSWIGGYNSMSRGDYSLAFGTYVKNYRAASVALGYYLRNNAGNSVMIGSGPGFGGSAYAVNDDTGSIKFFPFTTTGETRPMLNMKRDNTAEVVGVWNFISSPTINGVALSTAIGVDNTKVLKTGDTMTGPLTLSGSSLTVTGNSFSVGGSTLVVSGGQVSAAVNPTQPFRLQTNPSGDYEIRVNQVYNGSNYVGQIQNISGGGNSHLILSPAGGNVGIGMTTPSERLEVVGGFRLPKNKISPEGGFLVLAYNDSGVSVASGTIVNSTGSATDYGFKVNPIGGAEAWGAVYGSSSTTTMSACAAGTWCWICSGGLCGVNVDASGCATRGLWVGASNTTAGTVECIAEPGGVSQHDREIGHNVIATPAGGQAWIMAQFGR